jgi:hypothetical protein
MKKYLLFIAIAMLSATIVKAEPVSEKVLQIFESSFPEVKQTTWYDYESYYAVYFTNPDNSKCRIEYDYNGNIISTTRYYAEETLPPYIRGKVNEKYPGKNVFGVTEVSSSNGLVYHIVLEDKEKWYNITSDSIGSIHLEKKMDKAEK